MTLVNLIKNSYSRTYTLSNKEKKCKVYGKNVNNGGVVVSGLGVAEVTVEVLKGEVEEEVEVVVEVLKEEVVKEAEAVVEVMREEEEEMVVVEGEEAVEMIPINH